MRFPPIHVLRREFPKPCSQQSLATRSSLDLGGISASPPLPSVQSDTFKSVLGLGGCSPPSPFSSPRADPSVVDPNVSSGCLDHKCLINFAHDEAGSNGASLSISAPIGDPTHSAPVCCQAGPPPLPSASHSGFLYNLVATNPVVGFGTGIAIARPQTSWSLASSRWSSVPTHHSPS
ncbi:hypothetical protein Nepgr_012451 [Nepenthes gracilis]|uniref:Uncharacterized protein n=1 Tax=Nepenthes gracilis TaxID=150966 RepID=A0AAD3SFT8_NEPGR|nr:hypothetical protein Nepgr_012451 [Nepenthes gracilis]